MPSHDYEEFIAALNAHGVRYLVVGAHAVAYHTRPRATKDLDLLLDPSRENAAKVVEALRDFFGGADPGYSVDELSDPRWIIQLGVAPVRIDLLLELPGCPDFETLWQNRVEAVFGDVPAFYLGFEELLAAKRTAGRPQDQADAQSLARARGKRRRS
jgi:hypothetical protein